MKLILQAIKSLLRRFERLIDSTAAGLGAPGGERFKITVADDGTLTPTEVPA